MISYCKNGKSAQVLACPQEKLNEIMDSPQVAEVCRKLTEVDHDSDEAKTLKQQLPLLMFMANYTDGRRHAESAVPTGMAYLDLDELNGEDPREVWKRVVQTLIMLELEHLIVLVHVSCSGKGLRIVFIIPSQFDSLSPTERIDQSKRWLAAKLGVTDDSKTKDLARGSFAVPRSYVIYGPDKRLFEESVSERVKDEMVDGRGKKEEVRGEKEDVKPQPSGKQFPQDYNGLAYTDIIAKYWELFNGGKTPTKGDRDTLTYQLACDLRHICGRDAEWLDEVIPCYDGFPLEEKRAKIKSALQAKMEGMPYRLKQVLQALKSQQGVRACGGTLTTPPPMPRKLPPLIRLLTKNVPWFYKPAVANAVFPALGVHLHGVKFRYWDNVEHEATFMNILIGGQSIGKGTIKKPIEYVMEDIRLRDIPNRQREAEWKQKNPGAKPKKDPRPTDICIQMLIDNLTDAVFNQRIVDAHNNGQRFIYTIVDEIEGLKKVTSKGTIDEVGLLIRKAFDNSMAGQERVGADSVSGIAPLRWNFNASTTPPNAKRFFSKMVNDGTVGRLDISTIIRNDDDDDQAPILGLYDHQYAQELKPYIDRLEAASGLIECPQAKRLSLDMKQENRDAAKLYESEAYRVFSYRANVIAWLKGMVLYVAHGYKWSKEIADFVRWSQQYNLWCKMLYFGQQLERELREEVEIQRQSGPQNLLELLPDEFTKEQYRQMRQQQGKTGDGDSTLRSWQSRGYIAYDEVTGRYYKTDEYKKKYSK